MVTAFLMYSVSKIMALVSYLRAGQDGGALRDEIGGVPAVQSGDEAQDREESHSQNCQCYICTWIIAEYMECYDCCKPLQCSGPCVCQACGCLWCLLCHEDLDSCPQCHVTFHSVRPLAPCMALQRMVNDLLLPCEYIGSGCRVLLTSVTRPSHQSSCEYRN